MEPEERSDQSRREDRKKDQPDITREALYELVWAEPMLKVAARFNVSSSYMARICGLMNVPRPERGYWAKMAVGKAPAQPPLPEMRLSDQSVWNRSGTADPVFRPPPRPPATRPRRKSSIAAQMPTFHPLIQGAKGHFEVGRTSYWSKYLKPAKRNLVDLVVSMSGLDRALEFANSLFRELEVHECRVLLLPHGERVSRADVDEHEVPKKSANSTYDGRRLWSPARITVVYIGTIAIGLTVFEMSELADGRYSDGEYVRVDQLPVTKRGRYTQEWQTSKHDFPSGRLCLKAYCPNWRAKWSMQWRETKGSDLRTKIPAIIRELIDATPNIAELIAEGQRQAELERIQWEEQKREWEREQAEEAARKARKESRDDLEEIITSWARAKRLDEFFTDAERRIETLEPDLQAGMRDRLARARNFVGGVDALDRFRHWKSPGERLAANTEVDFAENEEC